MKTTVKLEDVRWEMDWSALNPDGTRRCPDKPEREMKFKDNLALALMLINKVIFLNDSWWNEDWPVGAKRSTSLNVNCNDVFAWGCADAESLAYHDIEDLYTHYEKDPVWGPAVWCIKKRNLMPQKPVYKAIQAGSVWDLKTMGLKPNAGWK